MMATKERMATTMTMKGEDSDHNDDKRKNP